MKYVLIKFSKDWADEFQAEGFAYAEKTFWEKIFTQSVKFFNGCVHFGTNEGWDEWSKEEYQQNFQVTEISEIQYKALQVIFPSAEIKYDFQPEKHNKWCAQIRLRDRGFGIFPLKSPHMSDLDEGQVIMYPDWIPKTGKYSDPEAYQRILDEFFDGKEPQ